MADVDSENQDLTPPGPDVDPPCPPAGADSHNTDGQDGLDNLFVTPPPRSSSDPLVISLDTDSDFSDGEDDGCRSRQGPLSPPGTSGGLFCSLTICTHIDHTFQLTETLRPTGQRTNLSP